MFALFYAKKVLYKLRGNLILVSTFGSKPIAFRHRHDKNALQTNKPIPNNTFRNK